MTRYLTSSPILRDLLIDEVSSNANGALVVFEGIVRDHHKGRAVSSILYEAYEPMAEKELALIVDGMRSTFPAVAVSLRHRLGLLMVGEASIVIACSSPHRAEAFDACRHAIDTVKRTVPIWKKEKGPSGEEWVGWQWQ